ncbi:MAG: tyrosinase family protein [Pseudomonadota bacterium]
MIHRRTALKAVAAAGAFAAFSGSVPGLRAFAAQAPRVRRSVNTMALDDPDLSTYRDFVGLMRARSASRRVSWVGFCNQHGSATEFLNCPHGDWYFLPWHRAFQQMYENAAMVLMRNPRFAMPYWDWTALRDMPAAFTDKTYKGKPNPLYVPGLGDDASKARNALTGDNALTDEKVGPQLMQGIYAETDYEAFGTSRNPEQTDTDGKWVPAGGGVQGPLEASAHNSVHGSIGGYMPGTNSPRDPVFFMHHGNIDRIWARWHALGRQDSTDPLWLGMAFSNHFVSPQGRLYTRVVKDLLSIEALGYTYDDMPRPETQVVDPERLGNLAALFQPARKSQAPRARVANSAAALPTAPLSLAVPMAKSAVEPAVAPVTEGKAAREVVALIRDIRLGDGVRAVRVFVNLDSVSADVPETDPHFVARLAFLRHGSGAHSAHKALPSALVNLTAALRKLAATEGLASDRITIQLVPVPEPGAAASTVEAVPGSIEIAVI